jgi:hypothetical protein
MPQTPFMKLLLFDILGLSGFHALKFVIFTVLKNECLLIFINMFTNFFTRDIRSFFPLGFKFLLPEVYFIVYLLLSLFFCDRLARYNVLCL